MLNGKCYDKWCSFQGRKKAAHFLLIYTALFAVLFLCTYLLFFINGKSFIWNYDGVKQHFTALIYLGRYYREAVTNIFHGNFVLPMYDFSIGMGEDVITSLNFYGLGDPLTLLAGLVPASKTELLYDFLVVFRMYLAGLSFSVMCRLKGKRYSFVLIGAVIYAFSGYILHVAVKHPFFVIPMIFLPISIVAVDRVIEKKKLTLLIVMVFFTACNGFYFFYMNTIFLVIYAVIKLVCNFVKQIKRKTERRTIIFVKCILMNGLRCAVAYVIGVAMAAVLFVPAIASYLSSTRSESAFDAGNLLWFDATHYNNIVTGLIGSPRITWDYLGMASIVLPALICAFMTWKKKNIELKAHLILWTVLMLVPFGGYMFNGFSYVSGRFTYLVTLVYAFCVVETLPMLLTQIRQRGRWIAFFAAGILYLAAVLFSSGSARLYGWYGFIMLVCTMGALAVTARKRLSFTASVAVILFVVSASVIGNGWLLFSENEQGQGYLAQFLDRGEAYELLAGEPQTGAPNPNGSFYRTDSSEKNAENACMITGDYGISSYLSISNPNRIRYLLETEDGGVLDSMFKINGLDGRTHLEALATVRYYAAEADDTENVPYGFKKVKTFRKNKKTYQLYENSMFLPLGITYDSYALKDTSYEKMSGLERQETMLNTVFLEEKPNSDVKAYEQKAASLTDISYRVTDQKHIHMDGDEVVVEKGGASLTLSFAGVGEAELYARLDGFTITQQNRTFCDITVQCQDTKKTIRALTNKWNWYFGREQYVFCLGRNKEANTSCKIKFQCKGRFNISDLKLYAQPFSLYEQAVKNRKEETMQDVAVRTNKVTGTINVSEDKLLFLSIPYSEGWTAYVDGKETNIVQADTAYMALGLEKGQHQIKLVYTTPFIKTGFVITLFGFILFLLYIGYEKVLKEGRQRGL